MVYQYKQKEILEERKKKSVCKGNKSALLLSKMYRRIERKNVTCPYKKKHSQLGAGDIEKLNMSFGTVLIEQHNLRRQRHSM